MARPDDITKAAWREASVAVFGFETRVQAGDFPNPAGAEAGEALTVIIARALMAAEAWGRAEEREACVQIAAPFPLDHSPSDIEKQAFDIRCVITDAIRKRSEAV